MDRFCSWVSVHVEWKLFREAKEQCKMITNFQCQVTLSTLRESGKNILPYSDGKYFTNFIFKNSARKQGNYQGIQRETI